LGLVKNEDKKALKAVKVGISNLVYIFNSDTVALTGRTVTRFLQLIQLVEKKAKRRALNSQEWP